MTPIPTGLDVRELCVWAESHRSHHLVLTLCRTPELPSLIEIHVEVGAFQPSIGRDFFDPFGSCLTQMGVRVTLVRAVDKNVGRMSAGKKTTENRTSDRLLELTISDLNQLHSFAQRRFGHHALAGISAEDMVQKALMAVVRGQGGTIGRRPDTKDLASKAAFIHYLRSVINSVTEAFFRKSELRFVHEIAQTSCSWSGERHLTAIPAAPDDLATRDLQAELFKRLKKRAPKYLGQVIEAWEKEFLWSAKLPIAPNRKHGYKVRSLAIQILREIQHDLTKVTRKTR